ncbi:hypothetical protein C8F04DRAFT_476323 [Mycena alexandri]|uniref:Uncharacterized protein n=1 Tax=Mycena alexandri TaxID=1745969 RepID=A0AAD6RYY2_9AGAR|nr:hypothetical protein C8F04DRAFT_476323 [Mycena alexandri]
MHRQTRASALRRPPAARARAGADGRAGRGARGLAAADGGDGGDGSGCSRVRGGHRGGGGEGCGGRGGADGAGDGDIVGDKALVVHRVRDLRRRRDDRLPVDNEAEVVRARWEVDRRREGLRLRAGKIGIISKRSLKRSSRKRKAKGKTVVRKTRWDEEQQTRAISTCLSSPPSLVTMRAMNAGTAPLHAATARLAGSRQLPRYDAEKEELVEQPCDPREEKW